MKENKLMKMPKGIADALLNDDMLLVVGGTQSANPQPSNNGSGVCNGANNSDGLCSGANNAGGSCTGANNAGGHCDSGINNSTGLCTTED